MVGSLGRTLYNLGQRNVPLAAGAWPERPGGPLAWLHLPGPASAQGMLELARRLRDEDGVTVLLTSDLELLPGPGEILLPPPPETAADARAFLAHWRPDIGIFAEGELRPALLHEAGEQGVPLLLVEAREPVLPRGREGWFPGLMRSALGGFRQIYAQDETAARLLRRAGAPPGLVLTAGRLEERSSALPCLEAERAVLATGLAGRPVWLGAAVPLAEEPAVLAAHRTAIGQSHRLLLIIMPEIPQRAEPLAAQLEADGWVVACRAHEQEPEAETEIYVVDSAAELGLWYRLAPITFLGGSLAGTGALRSPLEPAALGSALLHGPRPGPHGVAMGRLGAARAARAVASPRDLAEALGDLLSPERAARLAGAAWGVISDGAEVTDQVMGRIRQLMDGET